MYVCFYNEMTSRRDEDGQAGSGQADSEQVSIDGVAKPGDASLVDYDCLSGQHLL